MNSTFRLSITADRTACALRAAGCTCACMGQAMAICCCSAKRHHVKRGRERSS